MGYNNPDNKQSGRRNFGKRDFKKRDFGNSGVARQMFKTICSSCGKDCEVPFKPFGNKPVFCSNCFGKNNEGSGTRRFEDRSFNKPRFEDRNNRPPQESEQYNLLNAKLDKILAILTSSSLEKVVPTPKIISPEDPMIIVEKKKKSPKKAVLPPVA